LPSPVPPFPPGWIEVTAAEVGTGLTLVRGPDPLPIVLASATAAQRTGHPPGLVALPHGLTPGGAAELSAALALVVGGYDPDRARAIAVRVLGVLEAGAEGRRIPLGLGMRLAREWFETPPGNRSTTRRRP